MWRWGSKCLLDGCLHFGVSNSQSLSMKRLASCLVGCGEFVFLQPVPWILKNELGAKLAKVSPPFPRLVAFHRRPQIASDLGRNITCSSNPHRSRKRFSSGNKMFALWPQIQIAARCDWRIARPTHPHALCALSSPYIYIYIYRYIGNLQAAIAGLGPPSGHKSQVH